MPPPLRTTPFLAALCWLLLLPACSVAPALYNETDLTQEQHVLAWEDAYVDAEVRRDEAALRDLLDDQFVYNLSRRP